MAGDQAIANERFNGDNTSLLSDEDSSPPSSFQRSPILDSRPMLLTTTPTQLTPKYRNTTYAYPPYRDQDAPHTLSLDDDAFTLNVNRVHDSGNHGVFHRSLLDNITNKAHNTTDREDSRSVVVSRRFSAEDITRATPIQTYVILHEKSHDYQFFNQSNSTLNAIYHPLMNQRTTHKKNKQPRKIERLNFDKMENAIYHKQWTSHTTRRRGIYKWIICLLIGILTGLSMYCITISIQFILNIVILNHTRDTVTHSWLKGSAYYLGCNMCCALIAVLSVIYIERAAAGSGIPEVKAYLNGSWTPHLFNIRTFFVKLLGVCFAVSGSFIIGKEGPMVHAGAIIANGISRGRSRTLGFDCGIGYMFRNDNDARDFISCGAAAGVAAAFGAPVGGMLFALEEVSSFWRGSLTWRAFFCAAVSAFFLDILLSCFDNNATGRCGIFTHIGLITFNTMGQDQKTLSEYTPLQLIAFLIIGAIGGCIGASFNYINVRLCYFRKHILYPKRAHLYPILDVLFASFMTTMIVMIIPQYIYPVCRNNNVITASNCNADDSICSDIIHENQFNCDSNSYNALSALLLGEREHIIKYLFHYDSAEFFAPTQVIISCVAYFVMAVYTYGLCIPSGLFVPLILIGSTFGWWFGYHWELIVMGNTTSTMLNTYALIGASALLGGSTRMTISLTAIIMEITNDIYYLLPIMLVIMMSKWTGDQFNAAIYESHVALSAIPYLEHSLPKWIPSYLCAKDVMTKNVQCLPVICPLRILNRYLRDKDKIHNAFPIIDCDPNSKQIRDNYSKNDGKFVGIMLRWHIMILLSKRNFGALDTLSELPVLSLNDLTDSEYKNKYIASYQKDFGISFSDLNTFYVDFSPYLHLTPFTVAPYTPVDRVYTLFRGLGLRHLVVLDENNKQIDGIITARNLSERALERAVNKIRKKRDKYQLSQDDYVCHRLQQMNQSKICKKYKLIQRLNTLYDHSD
eukprot:54_1